MRTKLFLVEDRVMEIPVLIEPNGDKGYQARVGDPFRWVAEGATPDEALANLRRLATEKIAAGVRIASLEIVVRENPWLAIAGSLKDHPLLDEWREAMA